MRVVLVGPTHPYKGGIAQHTTELAHRLAAAGHDVALWSWSAQYPARLYPGQQTIATPELPVFPRTSYPLSWKRPDGWWRAGRRLRRLRADAVVVVWVTPVQAPAYLTLLVAAGRRVRRVVLCHNVLPHERRRVDEPLTRAVLRRADAVLVHSADERERAQRLTGAPVEVAALPPLALTAGPGADRDATVRRSLLFFGMVRRYKGLDVALRALAAGPPDLRLVVAGEFWEDEQACRDLVDELGLAHRVAIRAGYVDTADVPGLFAAADALLLPYRAATSSAHAYIAHSHGIPVVASAVGTLREQVRDGVDGLLVPPDDPASLAAALTRLYEPGFLATLRSGVATVATADLWGDYVAAATRALR